MGDTSQKTIVKLDLKNPDLILITSYIYWEKHRILQLENHRIKFGT